MEILKHKISRKKLAKDHLKYFKTMVKAVADIKQNIMAIDAELHADLEGLLLEKGAQQEDLWGFNLYPQKSRADFIEYEALINIRPHQGNPAMKITSASIKKKIQEIVSAWVAYEA